MANASLRLIIISILSKGSNGCNRLLLHVMPHIQNRLMPSCYKIDFKKLVNLHKLKEVLLELEKYIIASALKLLLVKKLFINAN